MMKIIKVLSPVIMAAGLGLMGFTFPSAASANTVAVRDGDLPLSYSDYQGYCRSQNYRRVISTDSGDANFILCKDRRWGTMVVTIADVCNRKYSGDLISRLRTMRGNPYHRWGCIRNNYAGSISESDMRRQCRKQGGYLRYRHADYRAYGWRCGGEGLNMKRLCKRLYGPRAIDLVYDLNDENSWGCYYNSYRRN